MDEPVLTRAEFAAYGGLATGVSQHLVGTAFVDCLNISTLRLGEANTWWVLALASFTDGGTADASYDIYSIHTLFGRDTTWIVWLDSNGSVKAGWGYTVA